MMMKKTDKDSADPEDPPIKDPFRPPPIIGKPYVHRPPKAALNDDPNEADAPDTEYEQGSDEMHKRLGL